MKMLTAKNVKENASSDIFQISNAQKINIFDQKEAFLITKGS